MIARRLSLICFFVVQTISHTSAQLPDTLSSLATVSLITTGSSSEKIYAAFGHSGIRIRDPAQGLDILFDYGIFDFSQPNFYLNYMKGHLIYSLGVFSMHSHTARTKRKGRSLLSQRLSLDSSTRQSLYDRLVANYAADQRHFRYDYIYQNCATKIRDLLEAETVNLRFSTAYLKANDSPSTARKMLNEKMSAFPWERFAINLLLGVEIDRPLQAREYMFLPEYVEKATRGATVDDSTKLVVEERLLLPNKQLSHSPPGPVFLLGGLLLIVFIISYRNAKNGCCLYWIDALLLTVCGLAGLVFLLFWIATDHHSAWNYNLLWAWPTHLLLLIVLCKKKWRTRFFLLYMKVYGLLIVALLLGWQLLPQQLPATLSLLWLSLLIRVAYHAYLRKKSVEAIES